MNHVTRLFAAPLTLLLGCGPVIDLPQDGTTTDPQGSTGAAATSGPSPTPSGSNTSPVPPPDPPATSTDPAASTTGGQDSTGPDITDGCDFLGCDLDVPTTVQCDVVEQNCPDGEKCAPWANDGGNAWNAARCVPVARNPDLPGEPCTVEGSAVTGIDSCALGAMCWNVDPDTLQGECIAQCTGSWDSLTCPEPTDVCQISGDGVLNLCHPTCDPVTQSDCSDGQGCYPFNDSFFCAPDASGDGGAAFDECEFVNACTPGTACVNPAVSDACPPDAAGCCLPWCDLGAPACPGDMVCTSWFEEGNVPEGSEFVGLCVDESALP